MAQLDDRSRRIIEARWLRDDDDTATLQQLADEYGVSAERIRQIESKASSMATGSGQPSSTSRARCTYLVTAPLETPVAAAIRSWLN